VLVKHQTNGQTEVVNKISGNLLQSFVSKNLKQWDLILTQVEFAYDNSINQARGKCPFEVAYITRPHSPLDLTSSSDKHQFKADAESRAEEIKKLHEHVQRYIIKQNLRYKTNRDKNIKK
jgi:uncharacterized FlaG/YvyC family protein